MNRRVNTASIATYRPYDRYIPLISDKTYYFIHIKYLDGSEEEVGFVNDKEKRDEFVKLLDDELIKE